MSKYLPFNLFIRQALLYPLTAPFLPGVANVKDGIKYAAGVLEGEYECPPGGGLPFTGQVTFFRTGCDGDLQKGLTLTRPIVKGAVGNTRFTDNGDGTITDAATGLMWVKDPAAAPGAPFNAKMLWNPAIDNCNALDFADHDDWRLPNINELLSIIDWGTYLPMIDAIFPNCKTDYSYWTSTTASSYTPSAHRIKFNYGLMDTAPKGGTYCWVRPVRLGLP